MSGFKRSRLMAHDFRRGRFGRGNLGFLWEFYRARYPLA